jgi:hypothetical protein
LGQKCIIPPPTVKGNYLLLWLSRTQQFTDRPCHSSGGYFPASHHGGPGSIPDHVGFVVDKVALGQVFSEYLVSPANYHSTDSSKLIIIYHPGLVQ